MDNPASLLAALQNRLYQRAPERHGISGVFLKALAVFLAVVRDLAFGQLMLRATSLVYTTLLSIVPVLALTFSVSKAFGVHGQIEPALQRFMEPLGPKGAEITTNIMSFIDNMHVGVLGSVGLGMLLFTAVSTILKIESSINTIWHVKTMRPLSQRISYYLCVMLLGPILVVSALGLNATLASSHLVQMIISVEPFGHLAVLAGRLLPYVLVVGLFLFLYLFMPNTKVRLLPALTSALVAGICWQSAGWAFARFVAGSTQYAAIYSSLAILIIFMIWLYVSWIVVLVGASVGFYMQHTECLMAPPGEEPHLSAQSQDQLALAIMQALGERYLQGNAALRTEELAKRFHTPGYAIDGILEALAAHGIVVRVEKSQPTAWMPGRDLSNITPWQVLEAVRHAGDIHPPEPDADRIIQTFSYAQDQMSAVLSTISFRDLLTQPPRDRQPMRSNMAQGIGGGLHTAPGGAIVGGSSKAALPMPDSGGVSLADEVGGVGLRSTAQRRAALQQLERHAQREADDAARLSPIFADAPPVDNPFDGNRLEAKLQAAERASARTKPAQAAGTHGASAPEKPEHPAGQPAPPSSSAADKAVASRQSPASGSTPPAMSASATDKASPHVTPGPAAALRAGTPPKGASPVRPVPSTGHARDLFRGSLGKA